MTEALRLHEVAPGVHELRLPIPFEDGLVNAFLFSQDGAVDLIDCGMNRPESLEALRAAISELGGRLRRLVVTHIHPDHYGAAGVLASEYGADLYLHRLEIAMVHLRYLEMDTLVEEVGHHLRVNGVPPEVTEELKNASRGLREFVTPAGAAVELEGAETIELGGRRLRVEWTPGHSPGHICLWDPDDRVLFAGDQLLPDVSPNIGLHPQSTPNPLDEYLAALDRLLRLAPAQILPAHGRPFTDAAGRVDHLREHHRRRKDQIEEIVGGGELSAWEVALAVWGDRELLYEKRLALQEGLAHLQSLAVEGRLEKRATPSAVTWRRPPP
ncbi:MAG TPA: MBL fold metallo-hydrolase [Candidatus Dormibacteraeota bacterium]